MYTISKTFPFCYGHRLLNDPGRCRHIHGHTARATLILGARELDERGMVFHFDRLKETIGKWIADNFDHTLLLIKGDPLVRTLEKAGEKFRVLSFNPTAENLARIIFETARGFGLPVSKVEVWESETSMAAFLGAE